MARKKRIQIFEACKWRCCTQEACFRGRTRDSEAKEEIAAGSTCLFCWWTRTPNLKRGSEIETLENHFVKNHFLIDIINFMT